MARKPDLPGLRTGLQPELTPLHHRLDPAAAATAAPGRIGQPQHDQRPHDHRQPSPLCRAPVSGDFQLRQHEEEVAERLGGQHHCLH